MAVKKSAGGNKATGSASKTKAPASPTASTSASTTSSTSAAKKEATPKKSSAAVSKKAAAEAPKTAAAAPQTAVAAPQTAAKKAAVKKAAPAPVKLSTSQTELLKKIHGTPEPGYRSEKKAETKTLDSLASKKLIKKGAKHKESGTYHYQVSSAGKKHVESHSGAEARPVARCNRRRVEPAAP